MTLIRSVLAASALALAAGHASAGRAHFEHNLTPSPSVITPGSGWTGATAQPSASGVGYGATEPVIANFDTVDYQTVAGAFTFGVMAFHIPQAADVAAGKISNVDYVDCSVDNGPFARAYDQSVNPNTGVLDYVFTVPAGSTSGDGQHEARCIAYPAAGIPIVLQGTPTSTSTAWSLFFDTNAGGTIGGVIKWANSVSGTDVAGCGVSAGTAACQTLSYAKDVLAAAQTGGDAGNGTVCLAPGSYSLGKTSESISKPAATGWFTVDSCGNSPSSVVINDINQGATTGITGLRVAKLHLSRLKVDFSSKTPPSQGGNGNTLLNSGAGYAMWLDRVTYVGPGESYANTQPNPGPTAQTGGVWVTGGDFSNSENGAVSVLFNEGSTTHNISSDAFQNDQTVVNVSAYNMTDPITATATETLGTNTLTGLSNENGMVVGGALIANPGVNSTRTIVSIDSPTQVTFSGTASTVTGATTVYSGFHADVYQNVGTLTNIIIYGLTATDNIYAQGFFTDSVSKFVGVALVNANFSNQTPPSTNFSIMQMGAAQTNMLWANDVFTGPQQWRVDLNFTATDFTMVNNTCIVSKPGPIAGLTAYTSPTCQ